MSLEIPADGDRVCINISIVDDSLYEDLEEVFSVCIDSDDALVTVAFSKAEVTIVDNNGEYNIIPLVMSKADITGGGVLVNFLVQLSLFSIPILHTKICQ